MLTVAEGGVLGAVVVEAHPEMRRSVILAKAELMKLVFMAWRLLIGFTEWVLLGLREQFLRTKNGALVNLVCSRVYGGAGAPRY
jgi:hypothetical protein